MERSGSTVSTFSVIKGSVRWARSLHFILMGLLGLLLSPAFSVRNALLSSVFLFPSIFLVWLHTTMVNDAFDTEIDRRAHPERPLVRGDIGFLRYRRIYTEVWLLSILLAVPIGFIPLISIMLFSLLASLYSVPPFRVRDRPYATVIIGLASSLSFLAGYSAELWPASGRFFSVPPLSSTFFTVFLMILFALSISPLVNAYKDREADRMAGARNIYTILGAETGKAVVSILIPLLFSLPLIIFSSPLDMLVSLSFGLFAALSFFRSGESMPVFVSYFAAMLYFLARFLALL